MEFKVPLKVFLSYSHGDNPSSRTGIRQGASVARGFVRPWYELSARRPPLLVHAGLQVRQHWFSLRPGSGAL